MMKEKIFFYLMFLLILAASYKLLYPYLSLIIVAFLVVHLFKPIYDWLFKKSKNSVISTGIAILFILLSLLIPLTFVVDISVRQYHQIYQDINQFIDGKDLSIATLISTLNQRLDTLPFLNLQIDQVEIRNTLQSVIRPAGTYLLNFALGIGSATPAFIAQLIIFVILLATFFPGYQKTIDLLKRLSPLDDEIDDLYIRKSLKMTEAMVKGTLVVALAQAIAAGLFLFLANVPYVTFWILLMFISGVLPLGAGFIAIPIGVILLLLGQLWQGLLVIGGYMVFVSSIDNLLRPKLVSKDASLHPALVLLGILGGIREFGFLGFIYGPVILIFLTTTIDIYLNRQKF